MKQLSVLLVFTLIFIYLNMEGPNKNLLPYIQANAKQDFISFTTFSDQIVSKENNQICLYLNGPDLLFQEPQPPIWL